MALISSLSACKCKPSKKMYNTDEFFIFEILEKDDKTYLICCRKCYMQPQSYIIKRKNANVTQYTFNDLFSVNKDNKGAIEVFLSYKSNIYVSEDNVSTLQKKFDKLKKNMI